LLFYYLEKIWGSELVLLQRALNKLRYSYYSLYDTLIGPTE